VDINLLGSPAWDGRLLDDNLGRGRDLGNSSGSELEVANHQRSSRRICPDLLQVSSEASSDTRLFGGGVDGNEDEAARQRMSLRGGGDLLGLGDGLVDIGREEEISSSCLLNDLIESWLVDGEGVRVPSVDSGLVKIDDSNSDIGTGQSARVSRNEGGSDGDLPFLCAERENS
jgi:hypothetical protein